MWISSKTYNNYRDVHVYIGVYRCVWACVLFELLSIVVVIVIIIGGP